MVIIRSSEIRKMSDKEIDKKLEELRLDLSKKKAQILVGGAPVNAGKIKEIRKTIARIKTIRNQAKKEVIGNR
mgnify:CR=1 FL=1